MQKRVYFANLQAIQANFSLSFILLKMEFSFQINQGNFGNFWKSGSLFSKNACLPSCASSVK